MRRVLRWARARAQEPSTWVGMAVIAGTLGMEADTARALAEGVALVVGGALVAKDGGR